MVDSSHMSRSALLIIFLIVFVDLVGFGIVIPILPYYAQSFGAKAWQLGWLMAVYSLMQFLVAPIWGRISDFIGRRPVLLVSLLGSAFSLTILGLAGSLQWLFIGRLLAGICGANISTAYAYVADVTTEQDRTKGMGLIGAGFGLGFIFGPAIGGVLARYGGYSFPMFAAAIMALMNFIFAFFKLEEPPLTREIRANNRSRKFSLDAIRHALSDRRPRLAIGVFFLVTFAITQMEVVFALYMGARFQFDAGAAGVLLAFMGIIMVTVQGGLIGRLSRRHSQINLIIAGCILCSLALAAFASVSSIVLVVLSLGVMAFGHGVLHPSLSSLASTGASLQRRGGDMGVFHSAGSLARVLGPPIAGFLFDRVSWRSPFYTASMILAFAVLVVFLWIAKQATASPVQDRKPSRLHV